jgi:hypothetical protein
VSAPADTTTRLALSEAERESLEAAARAFERGEIAQREVAPGAFVLVRS